MKSRHCHNLLVMSFLTFGQKTMSDGQMPDDLVKDLPLEHSRVEGR